MESGSNLILSQIFCIALSLINVNQTWKKGVLEMTPVIFIDGKPSQAIVALCHSTQRFILQAKGKLLAPVMYCKASFFTAKSSKNPLLFDTMNLYESDLRMLFLVNLDVSEKVNTSCMDMHWNSELSIILKLFPSSSSFFSNNFWNFRISPNILVFSVWRPPPGSEKNPAHPRCQGHQLRKPARWVEDSGEI